MNWVSPMFITQKKEDEHDNCQVQWIYNFYVLNKVLERAHYPIPQIKDIILKQSKNNHFTKIDILITFIVWSSIK